MPYSTKKYTTSCLLDHSRSKVPFSKESLGSHTTSRHTCKFWWIFQEILQSKLRTHKNRHQEIQQYHQPSFREAKVVSAKRRMWPLRRQQILLSALGVSLKMKTTPNSNAHKNQSESNSPSITSPFWLAENQNIEEDDLGVIRFGPIRFRAVAPPASTAASR